MGGRRGGEGKGGERVVECEGEGAKEGKEGRGGGGGMREDC